MADRVVLDNIKRFFYRNKMLVVATLTLVVLGLATGVLCTLKTNSTLDLGFLQDFCLKNYFLQKYSIFAFIFIKFVVILGLFVLMFLLSFIKIGNVLSLLLCFYLGFLTGIDGVVLVCFFGAIKGLLLALLVVALWQILLIVSLVFFAMQMSQRNRGMRCYGKSTMSGIEIRLCLFYSLFALCCVVLQGVFLGTICKIFVF